MRRGGERVEETTIYYYFKWNIEANPFCYLCNTGRLCKHAQALSPLFIDLSTWMIDAHVTTDASKAGVLSVQWILMALSGFFVITLDDALLSKRQRWACRLAASFLWPHSSVSLSLSTLHYVV